MLAVELRILTAELQNRNQKRKNNTHSILIYFLLWRTVRVVVEEKTQIRHFFQCLYCEPRIVVG